MDTPSHALSGFATDLFAGVPVRDLSVSTAWYERLLGGPPSFRPNDVEAVWQLAHQQWLYVVVQPDRAGGSVLTVLGDDLDALISAISRRGIRFDREETPEENSRKVIYLDPDGNEIGFASVGSTTAQPPS